MAKRTTAEEKRLREVNAGIAATYDFFPYEPTAAGHLDPAWHQPLAAVFGLNRAPQDILDLACGTGAHLELAASQSSGRLVAIDLSASACEQTRARFAALDRPVEVHCMDLLDVDPEALGQFDLITCIGLIYTVPEPVRAKSLEIIGRCLRPGGIAVLSYYSGMVGQASMEIQRLVKVTTPVADIPTVLAQARHTLSNLQRACGVFDGPAQIAQRLDFLAKCPDANLFHELLGPDLTALRASDLNEVFSPHGIGIVGCLPGDVAFGFPTSAHRSLAIDARELMTGGYHYVAFAKWPGESQVMDPSAPGVVWASTYAAKEGAQAGVYYSPLARSTVTVPHLGTRGALEALAAGPLVWDDVLAAIRAGMAKDLQTTDELLAIDDLLRLWRAGGLGPRLDPALQPRPIV